MHNYVYIYNMQYILYVLCMIFPFAHMLAYNEYVDLFICMLSYSYMYAYLHTCVYVCLLINILK